MPSDADWLREVLSPSDPADPGHLARPSATDVKRRAGWWALVAALAVAVVITIPILLAVRDSHPNGNAPAGRTSSRIVGTSTSPIRKTLNCDHSVDRQSSETMIRQSGQSAALLPANPPTTALVCGYDGSGQLIHSARLAGAPLSELVGAIDALPLGVPTGTQECPEDTGAFALISFEFTGHPDTTLFYGSSGCQEIISGTAYAGQGGHPAFDQFQEVFERVTR